MKFMAESGRTAALIGGLILMMGSVSAWANSVRPGDWTRPSVPLRPGSLVQDARVLARPNDPVAPGDVVMRELNVPGMSWAGHTGVFLERDALTGVPMVLEALDVELQPNEEYDSRLIRLGIPDYKPITAQALHISPLVPTVELKTGQIVRLGFIREGLQYFGARAGLWVVPRTGNPATEPGTANCFNGTCFRSFKATDFRLSNRREAARLADMARQQMSYGSKYSYLPYFAPGRLHVHCVRYRFGFSDCLEYQTYKIPGTFRCDTIIHGFFDELFWRVDGDQVVGIGPKWITPSRLFDLYRVTRPRVDPAELVTR
jgi:hypothetical protein